MKISTSSLTSFFILLACSACSTPPPDASWRGAACAHAGEVAVIDAATTLICHSPDGGAQQWQQVGTDMQVTASGDANAPCGAVGSLAQDKDGALLRCTWNN